jgi:alpha-D-xyloside xylohydrolase
MVRPGTLLPIGSVDDRPDYDYPDGVTFRVYELADGTELTCAVSTPKGAEAVRLNVRRIGQRVTATMAGNPTVHWQLQFAGSKTVTAQNGVRLTADPLGVIVRSADSSHRIECELVSDH